MLFSMSALRRGGWGRVEALGDQAGIFQVHVFFFCQERLRATSAERSLAAEPRE